MWDERQITAPLKYAMPVEVTPADFKEVLQFPQSDWAYVGLVMKLAKRMNEAAIRRTIVG